MTSLSMNDDLYREAALFAAAHGLSVDEFVRNAVREAISGKVRIEVRNGVPIVCVPPGTPSINPQVVRRHLESEIDSVPTGR